MNFGNLAQQAQGLIGGQQSGYVVQKLNCFEVFWFFFFFPQSGGISQQLGGLLGGLGGTGKAPGGMTVQNLMAQAKTFLASRKNANEMQDNPAISGDGTVEGDLVALKEAMKGIGTDEEKLVNIIFRRFFVWIIR